MAKFKIGDKVLLKDPRPNDPWLSTRTTEMLEKLPQPLTITNVEGNAVKGWVTLKKYKLWASSKRFELAEPKKEKEAMKNTINLRPGDKLRLKDPLPDGHMYAEFWTTKLKKAGPIFTVDQSARSGAYSPHQGVPLEGIPFTPYSIRFELVKPKTIDDALEDSRDELDELEMTQKSLKAKSEQCKILEYGLNKSLLENASIKDALEQKLIEFNQLENRVLALTIIIERNDLNNKAKVKETPQPGDVVYDKVTGKSGILMKGDFGYGRVGIYRGVNVSRGGDTPMCSSKTARTVHDTAFLETLTLTPPQKTGRPIIPAAAIVLLITSMTLSSYITSILIAF